MFAPVLVSESHKSLKVPKIILEAEYFNIMPKVFIEKYRFVGHHSGTKGM